MILRWDVQVHPYEEEIRHQPLWCEVAPERALLESLLQEAYWAREPRSLPTLLKNVALSGDGVGYKQAQPGETIIKYMDIGKTFYVIFKGMVDVFCPAECTAYLGVLEYNKLLEEYRDMVLSIDDSDEIPEPNLQYKEMEAYQNLSIKDVIHRLEGTAPITIRKEVVDRRTSILEKRDVTETDGDTSQNMFLKLEQGSYK